MELVGQIILNAPRMSVWEALNNSEILARCIQGCTELNRESDTQFSGKVEAKVGPVKASFQGLVTLSDIIVGESYTISGEGKGGVAGFAKGQAQVALQDTPEGTLLEYRVKANVGGKLAQLGSRLIDAAAKAYADNFFNEFRKLLEPHTELPATDESQTLQAAGVAQDNPNTARQSTRAEDAQDASSAPATQKTHNSQVWRFVWLALLAVGGACAVYWLM
jgi:uncharacterized protein